MGANMIKTKCTQCGKVWWHYDEWGYKRNVGSRMEYYCSWHCLREREKECEEKKAQKKQQKEKAERVEISLEAAKRRQESRRRRTAERLARGVCPICEKPLKEGRKLCADCLAYKVEYNKFAREKKRAEGK